MELVNPYATKEEAVSALQQCVTMGLTDVIDPILKTHFKTSKLSDIPNECVELLTCVAKSGSLDVLQRLLGHVDQEFLETPYSHRTLATKLLTVAVTNGNYSVCGAFVARGGDPNGHINGTTLLHTAVSQGHEKVLEALMEGGADLTLNDRRGENLISSVIMSNIKNKVNLVSRLVSGGVDPKSAGDNGKQPIHVAAAHSADVISRLVELGLDVNQPDVVQNDTPLHIACCRCNEKSIETLIKIGAKFNLTNNEGETPLAKLLKFATNTVDFHSKLRMKLARQLIKYGFVCKQKNSERTDKRKIGRDKMIELYHRLQKEPREVSSLQHLSRLVISENLQPKTSRKAVFSLDIPPHLKDYLMFPDFRFS